MSNTYLEEMIPDTSGGKRNFEISTHSNSVLINIGGLNVENDAEIQLELDEKTFKKVYEALFLAGSYQAWLKR